VPAKGAHRVNESSEEGGGLRKKDQKLVEDLFVRQTAMILKAKALGAKCFCVATFWPWKDWPYCIVAVLA